MFPEDFLQVQPNYKKQLNKWLEFIYLQIDLIRDDYGQYNAMIWLETRLVKLWLCASSYPATVGHSANPRG